MATGGSTIIATGPSVVLAECQRCGAASSRVTDGLRHRARVVRADGAVASLEAVDTCEPCGGTIVVRWTEAA